MKQSFNIGLAKHTFLLTLFYPQNTYRIKIIDNILLLGAKRIANSERKMFDYLKHNFKILNSHSLWQIYNTVDIFYKKVRFLCSWLFVREIKKSQRGAIKTNTKSIKFSNTALHCRLSGIYPTLHSLPPMSKYQA